jgi:hypothetical protein
MATTISTLSVDFLLPVRVPRKANARPAWKDSAGWKLCFGRMGEWPEARNGRTEGKEQLPAVAAIPAVSAITAAATATTAAAVPTAATTPTIVATSTAATRTFGLRTGFINNQVPATEVLTVQAGDRAICIFITCDFNECKPSRLSSEAVPNQTDCRRANSQLTKPFLQLLFRCVERKITDVKLLHLRTPSARNRKHELRSPLEKLHPPGAKKPCQPWWAGCSVVPCIVSKIALFCNELFYQLGGGPVPTWKLALACHSVIACATKTLPGRRYACVEP